MIIIGDICMVYLVIWYNCDMVLLGFFMKIVYFMILYNCDMFLLGVFKFLLNYICLDLLIIIY